MRVLLLVLVFAASACAQQIRPGVERRANLGFGFHRDIIAEQNPPGVFESVGHFEYLFYRGKKLARLDDCLVSPSGDAIVYQEAASGNIFVYNRRSGATTRLTKRFPGLVNRFVWREREGYVAAFVVPSSTSSEPGRWITLRLMPNA